MPMTVRYTFEVQVSLLFQNQRTPSSSIGTAGYTPKHSPHHGAEYSGHEVDEEPLRRPVD
jgi:hypothetical protein